MKLSGNKLIESVVEVKAKNMVQAIEGEIACTPYEKACERVGFCSCYNSWCAFKNTGSF